MIRKLVIKAFLVNVCLVLLITNNINAWTFEGQTCYIDIPAGWDVRYDRNRGEYEILLPDTNGPVGRFEEISHKKILSGRKWWEIAKKNLNAEFGKNIAFYREMGLSKATIEEANATDGFMADFTVYGPHTDFYTSYYSWCFIRSHRYVVFSFNAPTSLYPIYEVGFETVCRGFRFKNETEIVQAQGREKEKTAVP